MTTAKIAGRRITCGLVLCLLSALSASCGSSATAPSSTSSSSSNVTAPVGGVAQFSVSPVADPVAGSLTPLGSLNPPGHTVPTDHVYFYQQSLAGYPFNDVVRTVYAPAKGTVRFVQSGTGNEVKVTFLATPTFNWYIDHLTLRASGLSVGTVVEAGEVLGTAKAAFDLGAWDSSVTLTGLATPSRYSSETLHCVSPWKYFTEPLRSQLYAKIHRAPGAADKDGKIDFDIPGKLVGAWYDSSLPKTNESSGPNGWPKTLGFVYDMYDPSLVRISIGGTIAPAGVFGIEDDAIRPENVSTASGLVTYRLRNAFQTSVTYGVMLVQMTSDTEIRVEVFIGATSITGATGFTSNARTYIR